MLEPYARAPWSPEDLGALLRAFWAGQAPDWRAPANGEPCLRREATAPRADQPTVYVQTAVRSAEQSERYGSADSSRCDASGL